jgi:hypothetical protein
MPWDRRPIRGAREAGLLQNLAVDGLELVTDEVAFGTASVGVVELRSR